MVAVSYAGVMGLQDDLNFPTNGFSNLAIAFYCSFLVFEPVQAVAIQRFPTAKYLGVMGTCCSSKKVSGRLLTSIVTLWGFVLTMNCAIHNYASVIALRVLLGVFESACAPR